MDTNEYVWVVESTTTGRIDSVYGNAEAATAQRQLLGSEYVSERYRVWAKPTLGLTFVVPRSEIRRRLRSKFGAPR